MLFTPRYRRALNKTACGFNVLPLFFCNQKKSRNGKRKVLDNHYPYAPAYDSPLERGNKLSTGGGMVSNINRLPDGVPGGFLIYRGSSTAIVAYATAKVIISMPRCKARA